MVRGGLWARVVSVRTRCFVNNSTGAGGCLLLPRPFLAMFAPNAARAGRDRAGVFETRIMSFPPSSVWPSRLTGLAASSLLAMLLTVCPIFVSDVAAGRSEAGTTLTSSTDRSLRKGVASREADQTPPGPLTPDRAGTWAWPVTGVRSILRPFIAPATTYSAGHRGIDIVAPVGSIVVSPAPGIVYFSGVVVDRSVVSIQHPDGVISSFEPVLGGLSEGAVVARGSPIGVVQAGHCTTACAHVGVRIHGEYVSPMLFFEGIPHAVLLPTRR